MTGPAGAAKNNVPARTPSTRRLLTLVIVLVVAGLATFAIEQRLTSVECELQRAFGQAGLSCGVIDRT